MKLGFIGTGNLATAILRGVVASGMIEANEIAIFDIFREKTAQLEKELGVKAYVSAQEVASDCERVVVAVKPKDNASVTLAVHKSRTTAG